MDVEDLFSRVLTPFFLLGDTARQVVGGEPLEGNCIIVGVKKAQVTPEVLSTFKTYLKIEPYESGITYKVDEVPVHIKFVKNHYKFLETLDFRFYRVGDFLIPNPFQDYWEHKAYVK